MKLDDLVVDGDSDREAVRKLVAGLRLLKAYGKVAERALSRIASGKPVAMYVPSVDRRRKGSYEMAVSAVHSACTVPPLPDYSALKIRVAPLEKKTPTPSFAKKADEVQGYLVYVMGPGVGVYPKGSVSDIACDADIGSAWHTKTRVSWNFRNISDVKSGKEEVCKAIAEAASNALVKLCSEGVNEVWHSQAKQVHQTLRARCRAILMADGHAERVRAEVVNTMTVNAVHAL